MSASTRTIQRPASTGSVTTAIAMGVIALAAALSISWGATNFVGKAGVAQPAQDGVVDGSAFKRGNPLAGAAPTKVDANLGAPGAYRPEATTGGRGTRLAQ